MNETLILNKTQGMFRAVGGKNQRTSVEKKFQSAKSQARHCHSIYVLIATKTGLHKNGFINSEIRTEERLRVLNPTIHC